MAVQLRKARTKHRDHRTIVAAVTLGVVAAVLAVAGVSVGAVVSSVDASLPKLDIADHQPLTANTYIYDGARHPHLLAVLRGDQSRVIVTSHQIAPVLKQAVVAIEDRRFYSRHQGVDYRSIARALLSDLSAGHTVQGGSTITQQFIKNAYLPADQRTSDTFSRKLREAVLAWQLEKRWSKDEILTNYLNTIYFGEGAYGIEMAARTFFGTTARRLTLPQAALLAGIVQDPAQYDPFADPAAARTRRGEVLAAMAAQGMVSAADAAAAARAPLPRHPHRLPVSRIAPYFVEYVIQELVRQFGATTAFGGGLRVYTTLDPRIQRAADRAATDVLDRPDDPAVSIVAIDPHTDEVEALVGGRDFARQQFDVAVDGRRQPGSAFKPFALAAAISQGMSPRSIFISEPKAIALGGGAVWHVSTYSGAYAGKISLADAAVESDNTVYADLSMMVGPANIAAMAAQMGITTPIGDNPAIALGGLATGVSPLEMANAYATLAAGGQHMNGTAFDDDGPAPISIRKVTDAQGDVLVYNSVTRSRVLEPWQAGLETSVLQQVVARGTGVAANIGRPQAGKTGTTTDYADAWFCGYTPDLSAAVWVGYPSARRTMIVHGIEVAGGTFPAEIWARFASAALDGVPAHAFPAFTTPPVVKCIVCNRTGELATRWCPERLVCYYFAGQAPTADCTYHKPGRVLLPDLTGLDLGIAQQRLRALELGWQVVFVPGDPSQQGIVLGQSPSPGDTALQGSAVTLRVDSGPYRIVPDVVGLYRAAAVQALAAAGFAATVQFDGTTGPSAGTVATQDPAGGTSTQGTVTIVVHGTDAQVAVPNVIGFAAADAQAALAAAGLGAALPAGLSGGTVTAQSPAAGASVEIGAVVQLALDGQASPSPAP
jgi:penicillin-binding protein 1A